MGKSKSTISMAIFNSYVKLPEGNRAKRCKKWFILNSLTLGGCAFFGMRLPSVPSLEVMWDIQCHTPVGMISNDPLWPVLGWWGGKNVALPQCQPLIFFSVALEAIIGKATWYGYHFSGRWSTCFFIRAWHVVTPCGVWMKNNNINSLHTSRSSRGW